MDRHFKSLLEKSLKEVFALALKEGIIALTLDSLSNLVKSFYLRISIFLAISKHL